MMSHDHLSFFPESLLNEHHICYDERQTLLRKAAEEYLAYHTRRIRALHRNGASGTLVVSELTQTYDELLRSLFRGVANDLGGSGADCLLLAIGGYGRAELNPRSDLDLLFFYSGKDQVVARQIAERLLYLLWDLKQDVGYSVRTVDDCLEMAGADLTARTALLDSRYLAGNEDLMSIYERLVLKPVFGANSRRFIAEKLAEYEARRQKFGSSVYLLEPNIKESEGGLRDLHSALWIARSKFKAKSLRGLVTSGVISEKAADEFQESLDRLWRIRNELHYLSSRKNDQLHFDEQEKIASFLGYRDNHKAPAVEQFMQDYYSWATQTEHLASVLIAMSTNQYDQPNKIVGFLRRRTVEEGFYVLRGELWATRQDLFEHEPARMMRAFRLGQQHNVQFSVPLKSMIRDNLKRINDKARRSRMMAEGFMQILRDPYNIFATLMTMHHLRFLNHFIPEFGRIYCKVQHDAYHIYTVDVHSIFAIEEIARLLRGECREERPGLTQVAADVELKGLLLLATLLHDIGKGEGRDHCNQGADLIPKIARRFGFSKENTQRIEFLVRNHLLMTHISQRRDLSDDQQIIDFARQMGMSENLRMLYLLTYADVRAVGPEVWSEWKGFLLEELYEKAYRVLEQGNFRLEGRSEKVRNRKRNILTWLHGEIEERRVRDLLKHVSTRYILSYRSLDIAEHFRFMLSRGDRSVAIKLDHDVQNQFSSVMVTTLDQPGLFSLITGVLAANGINIVGARVHTLKNGIALDILQVQGPNDNVLVDKRKWRKVEDQLCAVIEGRERVDRLVERRRAGLFSGERPKPRRPTRVVIDNATSVDHTIVEVYTEDKVGLLYEITKTLLDLGVYIAVSKISTKVDQVADTFYVTDIFNQKIHSDERLDELRQALSGRLDADLELTSQEPVRE
ncbi:MAG: [protein-PII] uridylyltransferase [Desulfuromonadales bacterium]|nr:[protein-PII] uridylyltransferase [Desulfuromonadales bacterium]